jgi:hypothetical protein
MAYNITTSAARACVCVCGVYLSLPNLYYFISLGETLCKRRAIGGNVKFVILTFLQSRQKQDRYTKVCDGYERTATRYMII